MTFGFIEGGEGQLPDQPDVPRSGVSQSGFFAWQERPACRRQRQDMVYLAHIRTAFALSNGTYGSPRMHRDLVDDGHEIGRHRTARLMRENQLIARQKRRFKRTTDSEHAWPIAPNLVAQDFTADGRTGKWGADISYIWTAEGWLYLAVVLGPLLAARRRLGHE
jgi:putative transposase